MAETQQSNDMNQPLLNLTPQEKSAYGHLFSLADTDSLGVLTGERAVSFFERTNVPAPTLGEIWQIADTENRGLLTKPGFCMVLRLIGWYQAGEQPRAELAFKPGPLPTFDGLSVPGVQEGGPAAARSPTTGQFPTGTLQPQLSGQSAGGGPIRVPPLDPVKVQQYSGLFEKSGAVNGLLDGGTAKSIFERAGLPNEVLGRIWMLSDREQRGALDQTEFIVAMHLLTSIKTRAMAALPNTLPPALYEAAARRGQRPPSRQTSGAPGGPVPRQFTGGSMSTPVRTQSPLAKPPGYATPPPQPSQTTGAPWLITQQEKAQYDRFFQTIDTSGKGVISGEQAVGFFSDSRLPEDTLASIWDLADINSEGQLNRDEFAVAMYLIRQQRGPNPQPLPAFLPLPLVPPSMRNQTQQTQQSTAPAFDNVAAAPPSNVSKSATEDLFGLDQPSPPQIRQQPTLQPQGTGASATRDPLHGVSQPSSPSSPTRFQPQPQVQGPSMFKQFVPTSAFGASLASQHTGGSSTSSQGQARGFQQQQQQQQQAPKAPMPSAMDDLLGDNDTNVEESSRLSNETSQLANMSNQIGNLRNQMETTQNKKTSLQTDVTATSNQKRDLELRLQQFRAQYETEVRTVKELETELAASRESTKKLGQEMAMLEGTYQDLQTQHQQVSQALQADQQENASLKQRISQINAEVTRLRPEIEKLKLDARQQKGLVSINKKQLATNEAERDRLATEKSDLEHEAAEQARSAAASPEPVLPRQASSMASPAASTMSSTNPFFKKVGEQGPTSPPASAPSGPTPSAFDTLFGPSAAFSPTGQADSRTGTPPATSFIGRNMSSMPTAAPLAGGAVAGGLAAVGAAEFMGSSTPSIGEKTPSTTPPPGDRAKESPLETTPAQEPPPPPPPESRQFTPTQLPFGGVRGPNSDAASSTKVVPPASRAGEVETPREVETPVPASMERDTVPGAFPAEDAQLSAFAPEVSAGSESQVATPTAAKDDFDSAFAGFGEGEKGKESDEGPEDPFALPRSLPAGQPTGFSSEFPPIQNLEQDDDSDSEDEQGKGGFDDDFTSASNPSNGVPATTSAAENTSMPATSATVASGEDIAAVRPAATSIESTASDLPTIGNQKSPPTYEQSNDISHGGSGERTSSSQFPPEFGNLLPAREDPTSPPPPETSPPIEAFAPPPAAPVEDAKAETGSVPGLAETQAAPPRLQNLTTSQPSSVPAAGSATSLATPAADVFHDASSRPMSSITTASPISQVQPTQLTAPKNAFDEFDDFNDLSEAREADKSASDFDLAFGRQSTDEFNPAFDSPAASMISTPMQNRSTQQSQSSNGFANFTPSVSTSSAFGGGSGSGSGSIQQTPQHAQHDWDAIFSGLDSSKDMDTSLSGTNDPWNTGTAAATTNGHGDTTPAAASSTLASPQPTAGTKATMPGLGRAITPGEEHDDPILKRLTGMGYPRSDALNALEMYDYDINRAVDHLSSN